MRKTFVRSVINRSTLPLLCGRGHHGVILLWSMPNSFIKCLTLNDVNGGAIGGYDFL